MKRSAWVLVLLVVVVAAFAGGAYWWTHRNASASSAMAGHFPARADLFLDVHELGQWMEKDGPGQAASGSADAHGTDPMLQVLKTVWAAPVVTTKDWPDILRTKEAAAAFWMDGATFKGVALMPLVPGERSSLEQILKDKLGQGPAAETVSGVAFRKLELPLSAKLDKIGDAYWGVGDSWIVVALGIDAAKAVLNLKGPSLAEDTVFLSAAKHFQAAGGASLFVRGSLLSDLARKRGGLGEEERSTSPGAAGQKDAKSMATGWAKEGLAKVLSLDSIRCASFWTAPAQDESRTWLVQSWLGFQDPPRGIWRLAALGSGRTPQMTSRLPKGGEVYVWGSGREPARLYQETLDELTRDLPPDQMSWVRAGIGAAEGKLGLSFANELLPALSDEWCFVSTGKAGEAREDKEKAAPYKAALFLVLRDARRFEDLVGNKIAPALHLSPADLKGARCWTWDKDGQPRASLVVAGGMVAITNDPQWALDTGGNPGRAWKAFSDGHAKACLLAFADPAVWSKPGEPLLTVSCESDEQGVFVSGRFPGRLPALPGKDHCGTKTAQATGPTA